MHINTHNSSANIERPQWNRCITTHQPYEWLMAGGRMFLSVLCMKCGEQQSGRIECSLNHTAKSHWVQLTAAVSQVQCGRAPKPTTPIDKLSWESFFVFFRCHISEKFWDLSLCKLISVVLSIKVNWHDFQQFSLEMMSRNPLNTVPPQKFWLDIKRILFIFIFFGMKWMQLLFVTSVTSEVLPGVSEKSENTHNQTRY